jgi:hypothetical protein
MSNRRAKKRSGRGDTADNAARRAARRAGGKWRRREVGRRSSAVSAALTSRSVLRPLTPVASYSASVAPVSAGMRIDGASSPLAIEPTSATGE